MWYLLLPQYVRNQENASLLNYSTGEIADEELIRRAFDCILIDAQFWGVNMKTATLYMLLMLVLFCFQGISSQHENLESRSRRENPRYATHVVLQFAS